MRSAGSASEASSDPGPKLHPAAARFDEVVDAYEEGRPDYSQSLAAELGEALGIAPGDRVLDLAAGTGKLTRALLAAGYDVTPTV